MSHRIVDLYETPQLVTTVARWIYDEFWADKNEYTTASLSDVLRTATSRDAIPLSLLAFAGDEPVGTVNLIENDDEKRTHLRPWLAALYVRPEFRSQGFGSALVTELARRAAVLDIDELYLGTDNPGFYARLGIDVYEKVSDEFSVMKLTTGRFGL